MKRLRSIALKEWLKRDGRKPLVIRGARQVGKTWLVRSFAEEEKLMLIDLNLEEFPQYAALFTTNDPKEILKNIETELNVDIIPEKSLLFLDEIQQSPQLFAKLRWFAEHMPQLPVIAAGSLLEFMLSQHAMSMPVGRIEYMHLEPLSFEEFLLALGEEKLFDYINHYELSKEIPSSIHDRLIKFVKEFIIVGGMPSAVDTWLKTQDPREVSRVHFNLINTYKDDFPKYSIRAVPQNLTDVINTIPSLLGDKFVYKAVNPLLSHDAIKNSLDLLCKARICDRVTATSANGIPLGAEILAKFFKVIFLDVGLCSTLLKLSLNDLKNIAELDLVNKGGIAEQLTGQLLRTLFPDYIEPTLYYWIRQGSDAEIDYLVQHGIRIIPLEVKAGATGKMKSLHLFMGLKKLSIAVRICSGIPNQTLIDLKDTQGNNVQYELLSIPFYLLGQLHRILNNNKNRL